MRYFFNRFENDALNYAYEMLESVTPLRTDCGKLCGGKCCNGDENDGMLLFPHEKDFFCSSDCFTVKNDPATGYDEVICNGKCDRKERPLACRIFPFFFFASKQNDGSVKLGVLPDTRARGVCPILNRNEPVSKEFERKMRMIAAVFEKDSDICDFLIDVTNIITDFGAFSGKDPI